MQKTDEPTESVPRRNPFNAKWRTDLPSFHECLSSLGSQENFRSFGEVLTAASPMAARQRLQQRAAVAMPKMPDADFSFLTLEVSEITPPTTPPQPVERFPQSCASSPEETPRRRTAVSDEPGDSTPRRLPPLCPNVSPIAHSPSAARPTLSSAPRTEPEIVQPAPSHEKGSTLDMKMEVNFESAVRRINPTDNRCERAVDPLLASSSGAMAAADAASEPAVMWLSADDVGLEEWRSIMCRAERIVPPLCESSGRYGLTEPSYHVGDFAYYRPTVTRGPARPNALFL